MSDRFHSAVDGLTAPARRAFAIVPHDSAALAVLPKALYVGQGGNLVLRPVDSDADVTLANVPSGAEIAIRPSHVRATGTTAGALVAFA